MGGGNAEYTKGAPRVVMSQAMPYEKIVALWLKKPYSSWCSRAYRVAVALEVTPSLL